MSESINHENYASGYANGYADGIKAGRKQMLDELRADLSLSFSSYEGVKRSESDTKTIRDALTVMKSRHVR